MSIGIILHIRSEVATIIDGFYCSFQPSRMAPLDKGVSFFLQLLHYSGPSDLRLSEELVLSHRSGEYFQKEKHIV